MSRYKVASPWAGVKRAGNFYLQCANAMDMKTGTLFREGAYRVVDVRKVNTKGQMKPAKVGKGGTVPFYGEMAWASGERLLHDLLWAER